MAVIASGAENGARLPTLFIPHGGGPWPFMTPRLGPTDLWDRLGAFLRGLNGTLPQKPDAVLVVSGHWQAPLPTVETAAAPHLLFDYYGFSEHTYRLRYAARGAPELASRTRELLRSADILSAETQDRGWDHGVFIPFMLIYPEADVPILQMSLQQDATPERHMAIGRALAPLRDEGALIVGSGMSYHNLREFFSDRSEAAEAARAFDDWLVSATQEPTAERRAARLASWTEAPGAAAAHPTAEHLEPLFVAAGAAGDDAASHAYSDEIFGKALSAFRFG